MIEGEEYYTGVFLLTATLIGGFLVGFFLSGFRPPTGAAVGFTGGATLTFLGTSYLFYGR
ncbi:hypothetical protein [Natronorarus salvus]|uniref:hypothetical protein n=1 Tax=Natronorarus salvus TaxID=3117733 RepID=UPI002F25FC47